MASARVAASISARATGSPHRICTAPSLSPTGTARQRADQSASRSSASDPSGFTSFCGASQSVRSGMPSSVAAASSPQSVPSAMASSSRSAVSSAPP